MTKEQMPFKQLKKLSLPTYTSYIHFLHNYIFTLFTSRKSQTNFVEKTT